MNLLAFDTAIFHEFASGTLLEFDVINFRFAARRTYFSGQALYAAHDTIIYYDNRAPVYTASTPIYQGTRNSLLTTTSSLFFVLAAL
jgi:hypothetical protein